MLSLRFDMLSLLALVLAAAPAGAASVLATVDSPNVREGESLNLTVEVSTETGGTYEAPDLSAFSVTNQNQMSSMSISIVGSRQVREQKVVYTYELIPRGPGVQTIGPARMRMQNGQVVQSQPLAITVGPAAPQPPGNDAPFPAGTDMFARLRPSSDRVYLGEQVQVYLELITRMDIADYSATFPDMAGFIQHPKTPDAQVQPRTLSISGMRYLQYNLRQIALIPLRAGSLTVGAAELELNALAQGGRDPLGAFFGNRTKRFKRSTAPIQIEVLPLPVEGQPPGFEASHVGRFQIERNLEPTRVAVGESVNLRVVLKGEGDLRSIAGVPKPELAGFKVYGPTDRLDDRFESRTAPDGSSANDVLVGQRMQEYLLVPEKQGNYTLPELRFTYFNPASGRYETIAAPARQIMVHGAGAATGGTASTGTGGALVQASDIKPIRYTSTLEPRTPPLHRRGLFWPLMFAPGALVVGLSGGDALLRRVRRDSPERRKKRALIDARLRIATARVHPDRGARVGELTGVVERFLEQRLDVRARGLTRVELHAALSSHVGAELAARTCGFFDRCDQERFAPSGAAGGDELGAACLELVEALGRPRRA